MSSTQPTHSRLFGSQIGAEPGHSELFVQSFPHLCVVVLQIGAAGPQSRLPTHSWQRRVCGSHTGVEPGHSELFEHSFPQVWVIVLQMSGALQFVLSMQGTQL